MTDFFGNDLAVDDIVVTVFSKSWGNNDLFEYCKIERFTEKAVIVHRLKLKEKSKLKITRRVLAHHLIKVDPAHYTMYILKKSKETV